MKRELSEAELLHKSASYCSLSEHCMMDVREKLIHWGADTSVANRIIKHLVKERYIDEVRYTKAFVNDKYKFNRWGKTKIVMALRQKKIDEELIRDSILVIEEESYSENLENLLRNKRRQVKDSDIQKIKAKLFRFGASRGYETQLILKTISVVLKDDCEDME